MKKMWTAVPGILLAAALLGVPLVSLASTSRTRGPVDKQGYTWTDTLETKSGDEWTDIAGLDGISVFCPGKGGASATVSLEADSGAGTLEVRAVMRDVNFADATPEAMRPPAVTFETGAAGGQRETFSYTFVTPTIPGAHGAHFDVQWRAAPTQTATLRTGSFNVLWNDRPGACL